MERGRARKRGHPNRGGGRFNRGRGGVQPGRGRGRGQRIARGGGGGASRGGGSGFQRKGVGDLDDWEDRPLDGLHREDQDYGYTHPSQSHGYTHSSQSRGYTHSSQSREPVKVWSRPPKVKVAMQRIQMSRENQDMIRDMLQDLHGEELDIPCEEDYDYLDVRSEDQYWLSDGTLQIEDSYSYATEDTHSKTAFVVNQFAINKLVRYGFDKERCTEAYESADGDIGASLEQLLCECFKDDLETAKHPEAASCKQDSSFWQEVMESRDEEMIALKSIYEDKFEERIGNTVWVLNLDLDHLTEMVAPQACVKRTRAQAANNVSNNICKYFLSGTCKYANRCKFKHVKEEEDNSLASAESFLYHLEVRFPSGNCYPQEPPLLAFSSTYQFMPTHISLNITKHLMKEAVSLSLTGEPAIFTLVSLLDDVPLLKSIVDGAPSEMSVPRAVTSRFRPVRQKVMKSSQEEEEDDEDEGSDVDKETIEALVRMTEKESEVTTEEEVQPQKFRRKDIVRPPLPEAQLRKMNRVLKQEYQRKRNVSSYKKMQVQRQSLPAWDMQDLLVDAISNQQVMVISGMTGCGKTTQVPQFLLDFYLTTKDGDMCNIVCTQPRRISAISVAERVAEERACKLGGIVGYQIRLESVQSSKTRLLFCTTGIILRHLEGDPYLTGITHIIVDEVHERSQDSDFLLMILKDLLPLRPDLKVILMSATLNAELFSTYFGQCRTIEIPGKTFPVDQYFLEDVIEETGFVLEDGSPYARSLKRTSASPGETCHSVDDITDEIRSLSCGSSVPYPKDNIRDENLTVKQLFARYSDGVSRSTIKTLAMVDHDKINMDLIISILEWIIHGDHEYPRNGAVLIFMPGFAEIQSFYDTLLSHSEFRNKSRFKVIPLHSTLSSEDQHAVFQSPPKGVTKIVIATNIAETSITIDDVVFVVDTGRMKEKRYDSSKGMESLELVWVSRANALQRRGRAGRVTSGVCFHLFTSHRFEHHLREQPIPEIQRAPLEQICLRIKMMDIFKDNNIKDVLMNLVEPPAMQSIDDALKRLQDLGALNPDMELTPLGYHLGSLPVDVRIGKLMLFGAIFRCLDSILTIAATLSSKSPFVSPFDKRQEADNKKLEFALGNSDHLTVLNAYMGWINARKRSSQEGFHFCRENFLSVKSLQMLSSLKQQFVELISDIGFVKEGITLRDVERVARDGTDGVINATGSEANANCNNWKLLSAVLVGALYPNVVQILTPETRYSQSSAGAVMRAPKPQEMKFKTKLDGYVFIHPSSVNFQVRHYESPYLVYHEKVKTSKVYIRDCTMVSVYPLLLFGSGVISIDLEHGDFVLSIDDGWIRFLVKSHEIAELVKELKGELDQLLADKISQPNMDLCTCPRGSRIIDTIVTLITSQ
ncbi:putative ATP-dependent RNA helicase DHX57 [Gigantopelta aegis]|uniref:putative ATP-dependent RNA helicase DHX57 n=1 Tax=Gigantopelta aegis TaxID=1735272 RepID=UPI001B88A7F2|nr:putative ATP-dependent RNA helicase DHX57 [Gigantopelta aegis]